VGTAKKGFKVQQANQKRKRGWDRRKPGDMREKIEKTRKRENCLTPDPGCGVDKRDDKKKP